MRLSAAQVEAIKQEAEYCFGARDDVRLFGSRMKKQRGFTLTELITVMVIIGIISVAAIPKFFDRNVFDSRGFRDQVLSTLRFAQKMAIAQRRFICVAFAPDSVTLTYDATEPGPAHTAATCPGTALVPPYKISAPTADVTISGYSDFYFSALGAPSAARTITVGGYTITVEAETGYVH
ncbi:MAG: type II secretion system protein [Sideroxydans sp.]|nr:type II secretion system protein [Sideroxydans sp.]